jgi:hypothetical protein
MDGEEHVSRARQTCKVPISRHLATLIHDEFLPSAMV